MPEPSSLPITVWDAVLHDDYCVECGGRVQSIELGRYRGTPTGTYRDDEYDIVHGARATVSELHSYRCPFRPIMNAEKQEALSNG